MKKVSCLFILYILFLSVNGQTDSNQSNLDTLQKSKPDSFRIVGKAISGNAAAYSSKADGTTTKSGEIFSNKSYTAAFNKFNLNSWIRVTNLKNNRSVLLQINDRISKKKSSPFIKISRAPVSVLGFLKVNNTKVKVEEIIIINSDSITNSLKYSMVMAKEMTIIVDINTQDSFVTTGKIITGIASFYSTNLDGTKTATGERYRNNKFTAASNNLKLNTWVLVTNLKNNNSVVVRINDRMHPRMQKKGRVVDLSGIAAKQLDFINDGLAKVKVEVILAKLIDTIRNNGKDSLVGSKDTSTVTDPIKTSFYKTKMKTDYNYLDFCVRLEKNKIGLSGHYIYYNMKPQGGIPDGKSQFIFFRTKNNTSVIFMREFRFYQICV